MQKINEELLKLNDDSIVLIKNLKCVFNEKQNNEVIALNNINLELSRNKIHFIIGNSGSGKSTLVYHFNGLLKSKKGYLNIDNFLIKGNKKKIKKPKQLRRIVSMVFQFPEYQLFKDTIEKDIIFGPKVLKIPKEKYIEYNSQEIKNIFKNDKTKFINILKKFNLEENEENINFFYKNIKFKTKYNKDKDCVKVSLKLLNKKNTINLKYKYKSIDDIAHEIALKYLTRMGLDESYLERNPFGLSGGQKRRVAIAGILAIEPKILIFDEPTAGLDPKGEQEMMDIILEAKKNGQTVIVITHTMDHVLQVGDNVIVLKNGSIFLEGEPYSIFTNEKLLKETKMDVPKVIELINKLIKKDKKFNKLLLMKPKTIEELAECIIKIKKKG